MNGTLTYKEFQASVTFIDGKLLIRVLHVDDLLLAECDSASEVQATFQDLIDDYLETCETLGKAPSRPFKGSFNVRITPSLHRRVAMAAAVSGETLNSWIAQALEQRLDRETSHQHLSGLLRLAEIAPLREEHLRRNWENSALQQHTVGDVIVSKKDAISAFEAVISFNTANQRVGRA